jgi:hypothetical protein
MTFLRLLAGHLLLHSYDPGNHMNEGPFREAHGRDLKERRSILMKPIMIIGIVLIALGIGALAYQGITYTSREKIIDIGPIQATREIKKTIPLSPILGGGALACGVVLVLMGRGAKN